MSRSLALVASIALVAFGCSRQKAQEIKDKAVEMGPELADAAVASPSATGGGPSAGVSRSTGRDQIAHARCQHLQTCGAIAKGKTYDDLDACFVHESAKVDDDLRDDRCAALGSGQLSGCLTTLKEKKCDAFFTSWPDACERAALCK
jgi:hypothetical protein